MRVWSSLALTALATAVAACGSGSASDDEGGTESGSSAESSAPGLDATTGLDASSSGLDGALGTDSFIPGLDSSFPEPDATTAPDGGGADVSATDAPEADASGTDATSGSPEAAAGLDATAADAMAHDSGGGMDSGPEASAPDAAAKDAAAKDAATEASTVNCSATFPSGGTTCTCTAGSCTNCNTYNGGAADGLNYGIWESGSGGSITYFTGEHAFSASWGPSSADFLAHVGLDYGGTSSYTTYGKIVAQFAESKSGSAGGYSTIGIYGWLQNPCVEYYITDDSYQGLTTGSVTATIDGGTYYLTKQTTTGTAGANACSGSVSSWTQLRSTRSAARQCGTITVSDHFAAWANQGWSVGDVSSIHINVEVGGGTGSIQFPTASVSTNN